MWTIGRRVDIVREGATWASTALHKDSSTLMDKLQTDGIANYKKHNGTEASPYIWMYAVVLFSDDVQSGFFIWWLPRAPPYK